MWQAHLQNKVCKFFQILIYFVCMFLQALRNQYSQDCVLNENVNINECVGVWVCLCVWTVSINNVVDTVLVILPSSPGMSAEFTRNFDLPTIPEAIHSLASGLGING